MRAEKEVIPNEPHYACVYVGSIIVEVFERVVNISTYFHLLLLVVVPREESEGGVLRGW